MRLKDLFSKLMWDPSEDLSKTKIMYVDRSKGHQGRTVSRVASLDGSEIVELGPGYIVIERDGRRSSIPFHRITQVVDASGRIRWSRGGEEASTD